MENTESFTDSFLNAIRNDPELGPRFKALEALEEEAKHCVHAVDLEVAFSPVLLPGCVSTDQASEVAYRAEGGGGVIKEPYRVLTEDELKLARACYLVARGNEMQPRVDAFLKRHEK